MKGSAIPGGRGLRGQARPSPLRSWASVWGFGRQPAKGLGRVLGGLDPVSDLRWRGPLKSRCGPFWACQDLGAGQDARAGAVGPGRRPPAVRRSPRLQMKLMVIPVGRSLVFSGSRFFRITGKKYFVLYRSQEKNISYSTSDGLGGEFFSSDIMWWLGDWTRLIHD